MQLIDATQQQQSNNKYTLKNLARNAVYALELTAMSKYDDKYLTSGRVTARLDTSMATDNDMNTPGMGTSLAGVAGALNRQSSQQDQDNDDDADEDEDDEESSSYDEDDDLDDSAAAVQPQAKSEPLQRDRPGGLSSSISAKIERAPSSPGIKIKPLKTFSFFF